MNRCDIVGNGLLGKKEGIDKLKELVKPYTSEQYKQLEQNTFQSPWSDYKQYNGMKFKVLSEHFDDDTREMFGNEYSAAWFDEKGNICSDRYFEVELENGKVITAEHEELSNYYVETNQIR